MPQQLKVAGRHIVLFQCKFQISNRLIKRFIGQLKSTPVNAHGLGRPHIFVNLHGLIRVNVLGFHKPARFVSAHRNCAEVKWTQAFSNFFEVFAVACVAREIEVQLGVFHRPTTPQ